MFDYILKSPKSYNNHKNNSKVKTYMENTRECNK